MKLGMPVFVAVAQFAGILKLKKPVGKRDKPGKHSTLGYTAKLNFELDSDMGDKVRHACFGGRNAN